MAGDSGAVGGYGIGAGLAGFASGLTGSLRYNQERADRQKQLDVEKETKLFSEMLPIYLQNADENTDSTAFLSQFPNLFPQGGGQAKKGEKSPFDKMITAIKPVLLHGGLPGLGGAAPTAQTPAQAAGTPTQQGTQPSAAATPTTTTPTTTTAPTPAQVGFEAATMPSTPILNFGAGGSPVPGAGSAATTPSTGTPAPNTSTQTLAAAAPTVTQPAQAPVRTLLGVPILSPTQKMERDQTLATAAAVGLMKRAREVVLPALKTVKPDATIDEALEVLGVKLPTRTATEYESVAGTINGQPAFGVFDKQLGAYRDPVTHAVLQNFQPKTSTSSAEAEFDAYKAQYAKEHGKTVADLTTGDIEDATAKYAAAKRAPNAATGEGEALAAQIAADPTRLQGTDLTPTVKAAALATIAKDPQLQAQYDENRMKPIRSAAQTGLNTLNDLITVDPKTGKADLTPGAHTLFSTTLGGAYGALLGRARGQTGTAKAALDQLTGKLTLDMLQQMRQQSANGATGFGRFTQNEFNVLQSSASILKGNITPQRALQELTTLYNSYQKILQPATTPQARTQKQAGPGRSGAAGAAGAGASGAAPKAYKDANGVWHIPSPTAAASTPAVATQ